MALFLHTYLAANELTLQLSPYLPEALKQSNIRSSNSLDAHCDNNKLTTFLWWQRRFLSSFYVPMLLNALFLLGTFTVKCSIPTFNGRLCTR